MDDLIQNKVHLIADFRALYSIWINTAYLFYLKLTVLSSRKNQRFKIYYWFILKGLYHRLEIGHGRAPWPISSHATCSMIIPSWFGMMIPWLRYWQYFTQQTVKFTPKLVKIYFITIIFYLFVIFHKKNLMLTKRRKTKHFL